MKIRVYLGILVVVAIALITTGMGAAASSDSGQAKNVTDHDGNWQTVLMADGKECEGMVFESAEAAQQEALNIGCFGYHKHHKDDGTVVYMPCALEKNVDIEDVKTEILDALAKEKITQEEFDGKLAWIEAKAR